MKPGDIVRGKVTGDCYLVLTAPNIVLRCEDGLVGPINVEDAKCVQPEVVKFPLAITSAGPDFGYFHPLLNYYHQPTDSVAFGLDCDGKLTWYTVQPSALGAISRAYNFQTATDLKQLLISYSSSTEPECRCRYVLDGHEPGCAWLSWRRRNA